MLNQLTYLSNITVFSVFWVMTDHRLPAVRNILSIIWCLLSLQINQTVMAVRFVDFRLSERSIVLCYKRKSIAVPSARIGTAVGSMVSFVVMPTVDVPFCVEQLFVSTGGVIDWSFDTVWLLFRLTLLLLSTMFEDVRSVEPFIDEELLWWSANGTWLQFVKLLLNVDRRLVKFIVCVAISANRALPFASVIEMVNFFCLLNFVFIKMRYM